MKWLIDTEGLEERAYRKYVVIDKRDKDNFQATKEFARLLATPGYLAAYSCKFDAIVRLVSEEPGNAFVYSEYVSGSGAIILALCFESIGFKRYNESGTIFVGVGDAELKPYCPPPSENAVPNIQNRRVRPDSRANAKICYFNQRNHRCQISFHDGNHE